MKIDQLLGALLAAPKLNGARCVGKWKQFDEFDDPEITEYCVHVCRRCPALEACSEWVDSLAPSKRPLGVTGGKLRRPPRPRKKNAA